MRASTRLALAFRALRSCRAGAALIEFTLLAPIALLMLFGLIEGGRMYWIKQTLNEVAYATARCMSVSSTCDTTANQQTYAVQRATGYAVAVVASDVTIVGNTSCKGVAGSNQVSVKHQLNSAVRGFLPFVPTEISATACFPVVS